MFVRTALTRRVGITAAGTGRRANAVARRAISRRSLAAALFPSVATNVNSDRYSRAISTAAPTKLSPPQSATTASAGAAASFAHNAYDVIVVGGGMVGATFALALASQPQTRHLKIAVLEAAPLPATNPALGAAPSIRVSSVTPNSAAFLEEIGAWSDIRAARATPFTEMQVWHTAGRGRVHWTAKEVAAENLGHIVENDVIQNTVINRLKLTATAPAAAADADAGSVEILSGTKVAAVHRATAAATDAASAANDWLRVTVSSGQTVSTRLLVGADGPQSCVKRFSNLSAVGWNYNQLAVVATVQHSEPHATAWQRFLPDGPIAFLPCHNGYSNIVWTTTPIHARHLTSIPVPQFIADVNSAFRAEPERWKPSDVRSVFSRLLPQPLYDVLPVLFPPPAASGSAEFPPLVTGVHGQRLHFPLQVVHGTEYVAHRVALIGDSAHTVHPMAGQGVNLGFGDAQELARTVARAIHTGQDIGSLPLLREYERERMVANTRMMAGVHAIKQVFSVNGGPFGALRGVGLDLFNSIPAIKNAASRVAMGLK